MARFVKASDIISLIGDNMTVGIGGFGGFAAPDAILAEIGRSYGANNSPKGLHIVAGIAPGSLKEDGLGLNAVSADGIIASIYAAHVGMPPAIGRAVGENKIAGFIVPLGVYDHLLGAIAGKKPGIITSVGMYTYCDPRIDGCKVNEKAKSSTRQVVSVITVDEKEYLFYRAFPIDVCIVRGTSADELGNISMEDEAFYSEQQSMASAVRSNGGTVIVQVARVVRAEMLHPRLVQIHHSSVDFVVLADAGNHLQCYDGTGFRPELTGALRTPPGSIPPIKLCPKKICARRGAVEIAAGALVNLGLGTPDAVGSVIDEEGLTGSITFTVETGVFGGTPVRGVGFGAAVNPEAVYQIADNFDFYDGGGLDMAFLGAAEIDEDGNVNVSMFASRCTGPGGFINISQNTKRVCFLGTFTAGHMEYETGDGNFRVLQDAPKVKFKKSVEQITFSSRYARESGQEVLYITERAVFRLVQGGIMLTEMAGGVNLETDILAKMEFRPLISPDLKQMDAKFFRNEKMNLALKVI